MTVTNHLVAVTNQSSKVCQWTAQKPALVLHLYSVTIAEVPASQLSTKISTHFDFNRFFF